MKGQHMKTLISTLALVATTTTAMAGSFSYTDMEAGDVLKSESGWSLSMQDDGLFTVTSPISGDCLNGGSCHFKRFADLEASDVRGIENFNMDNVEYIDMMRMMSEPTWAEQFEANDNSLKVMNRGGSVRVIVDLGDGMVEVRKNTDRGGRITWNESKVHTLEFAIEELQNRKYSVAK